MQENQLQKQYPRLVVDLKKLRHNIDEIVDRCAGCGIAATGVVKGFNGLPEILSVYKDCGTLGIASSRLEHLEQAGKLGLKGPFLSIRIPMLSEIPDLVRIADWSLASERIVLEAIEDECRRQKRRHGAILMVDLGDLREGFWNKEELLALAEETERKFEWIDLIGIGTNLNCYGSIAPTAENLQQLVDLARQVEIRIGRKLQIVSGGSTTSLPLVYKGVMPRGINHLRIGEAMQTAADLEAFWGVSTPELHKDVFTLQAEIVELKDKPSYPVGEIRVDGFGKTESKYVDRGIRRRAIAAVGRLDFSFCSQLLPVNSGIEVLGASSDHLILDVEEAKNEIKMGSIVEFRMYYGPMLYLTNSGYISLVYK